jgi:hypothetical protein
MQTSGGSGSLAALEQLPRLQALALTLQLCECPDPEQRELAAALVRLTVRQGSGRWFAGASGLRVVLPRLWYSVTHAPASASGTLCTVLRRRRRALGPCAAAPALQGCSCRAQEH